MPAEPTLGTALARLESRWGSAAVRVGLGAGRAARGGIVAFLDLCRIFDPLEAVARGIDLRWLLVLRPADADEGWALAAALVYGRQIDLLVGELPEGVRPGHDASLRRLAAHARRQSVRMIVLEPANPAGAGHGAPGGAVA